MHCSIKLQITQNHYLNYARIVQSKKCLLISTTTWKGEVDISVPHFCDTLYKIQMKLPRNFDQNPFYK